VAVTRRWHPGDELTVTLPMGLAFHPAPDNPAIQAVSYGPVVLSGLTGDRSATGPGHPADSADEAANTLPVLDLASIRRTAAHPVTFQAIADADQITMIPVARARHDPYTVYWYTDAYIP
jgi:DUF1680 family protein